MARNKRGRGYQSRLARPYPLDHTANRNRDPFEAMAEDSETPPEMGGFFSPTVRPLIRTVLVEPAPPFQAPPRRGTRQSPLVSIRATFRSGDKAIRSPFKTATGITPQLAERAMLCARRSIRREVIFATKSSGRGAKSPRRTRSKVKC